MYFHLPDVFDFVNLEELRIGVRTDHDGPQNPQFLESITSPCLRRVIVEVTQLAQWPALDDNLASLVERHKIYRNVKIQISTTGDPEEIRRLLPRTAQGGLLKVRFSERPDYCAC